MSAAIRPSGIRTARAISDTPATIVRTRIASCQAVPSVNPPEEVVLAWAGGIVAALIWTVTLL